jgi:alpha-tubulin suppressor-like RCC1 family protein
MLLEKWLLTVQPSTGSAIESLYMFGNNTWGQLGIDSTVFKSSPTLVGSQSWSSIASGLSHTIGIRSDGKLFGWGANTYGQIGNNDLTISHRSSPVQIGVGNWNRVSTNGDTSYAINSDGLLFAWGLGFNGQLGNNSMLSSWASASWTQILAGNTIGIESDGSLWAIGGINNQGQLGLNDLVHRSSPVQIGTSSWVALGGSGSTTRMALRLDNTLWVWGSAGSGQGGNNNVNILYSPTLTGSLTSVQIQQSYTSSIATTQRSWTSVSYGALWSLFAIRNDGALFAWGINTNGALGLNDRVHRSSPVQVGTSSWISVSSNGGTTLAIRADDTLWAWGLNNVGQLGQNDLIHRSSPIQVGTGSWSKLIDNGGVNQSNVAAIASNGLLWAWGNNTNGQLGQTNTIHRSSPVQVGTSSWTIVSAGTNMAAGITTTGGLFTWGDNSTGQLGDNTIIAKSSPIQVGTSSWTKVTSGTNVTMGITTDGSLFSWGTGTYLGQGLGINRSSPVQITSLTTSPLTVAYNSYLTSIGSTGTSWISVTGDTASKVAIRNDGTLFAWGTNTQGSIGDNTTLNRSSPVQIGTDSWIMAVSGGSTTLAIKSDNTLFVWGQNNNGQLGLSNQVHRSSPVQVGTDTNWKYVTGGGGVSGAIKTDGSLWMWGDGGALGLNDIISRSSPVQVGSSSWSFVSSTKGGFTLALTIDGALFSWGSNSAGQLGLNDSTILSKSSPTQVGTSSWIIINSATSTASAITSDYRLFVWGYNFSGQLGLGNQVHRSSPTQLGTSSWTMINSNGSTMYAKRLDGTLWAWGYNGQSEIGANMSNAFSLSSPVQLGTNSWSFIGAYTASIDSSGMLWSWGLDQYVGTGNNSVARSSPVFIISGRDSWTSISSGSDEYGGIRSDGILFRWGYNGFGALGGSPGNQTFPSQITTSSWTMVPAGASGSMGITSAGQLYTWGIGGDGQIGDGNMVTMSTPVFIRSMNDSWTSVGTGSVTSNYVAGIRNDNTLWLWGLGTSGQLGQNNGISRSQPIQLGKETLSWTYIAGTLQNTNEQSAAGIRSDGSLWTWGNNTYGQLGTNNLIHRSSPVQIGTSSWTQVSTGASFMMAITTTNNLWSWGSNASGALGLNDTVSRSSPVQVSVGTNWLNVSAGRLTPTAIRGDRILFAWGLNTNGNVGDNTTISRSAPIQIGNILWTSVVSGLDASSYGIRLDGTLWSWGKNTVGELGEDDTISRSSPVQIGTNYWKKIAAGFGNAFSIDINNKLWSWGNNSTGQLGINDTITRSSPVQVGTSSWTMVSAGQSGDLASAFIVSAIRSDGALFTWGNNTYGGLGDNTTVDKSSPVQIGTSSWTLVAGRMGVIQDIFNNNGYLYTWGSGSSGELGNNNIIAASSPVQIAATINNWYSVGQGDTTTIAIRNDKTLWGWGDNTVGQVGDNTTVFKSSPVQIGTSSWTMISTGTTHTLALTMDNILYGWGNNDNGQLGTGTALGSIAVPVIISSLITLNDEIAWSTSTGKPRTFSWTTVSGGSSNSFALRSDGGLFAWGLNTNGQLGLNDILHRSSPVQIGTSSWTSIAAGLSHSYAIRSDGMLFIWGGNTHGQLGLNDLVHRSSPVQVGTSSWIAVTSEGESAAGNTFAIALDGKLFGWGLNTWGALGLNNEVHRSSPVQVGTGNSWTFVSANANSTLAIRNDSKLFVWGLNTGGELGLNDQVPRSSPVQLGSSNWNKIAIQASAATIGIASDNTLYTWGNPSGGQLGDTTLNFRSSPVQIVSFNTPALQQSYLTKTGKTGFSWTMAVNTNNTMYAIRNDGLLFSWGDNTNGALGLGDILSRSSPVQVGTSSWTTIAAGSSFAIAIRSDNTLWTWGVNTAGTIGDGTQVHRSSPVQIGSSTWSAVAAGPFITTGNTALAIRSDGTLWGWGANDNGQLGLSTVVSRSSPVQIGSETTWSKVFSGSNTSAAIRTTGALYAWGLNTFGQVGDNTILHRSSPVQIGTSSWTAIASGVSFTLGIRSGGNLFTWGGGSSGQLGTPDSTQHRSSPVQIGSSSWSVVTASGTISAGISGNLLYMWGLDPNAQFGNNTVNNQFFSPTLTTGTSSWTTINTGSAVAALDANRQLFTWGTTAGTGGVIGNGIIAGRSSPVFIRSIADSWNNVGTLILGFAGIRSDGLLFTWGGNTSGTTGDNSIIAKSFPTQLGTTSWTMVTGYANILGITAADTGKALFAWGLGTDGSLGILSNSNRSSPVFIRSMNDSWISVGAGQSISSAIRSDGKLFTWGLNTTFGQLGDNTTISKSYPTQIGNNSNWAQVSAAGPGIMNAITTDGNAYIWGNNTNGNLGLPFNPTTISGSWLEHRSSPVQVGATPYSNSPILIGTSSWTQVSAGVSHVLAISSTNKLFAWGANSAYQVNDGGINRSSPVQIGTSSWTQISAGNIHSLAIASDNTLYGWGLQYQQWAYNPTASYTNYLLPTTLTTSWSSINGGATKYFGIRSDGSLWSWGSNTSGELGLNDIITRSSPVQVGASSWTQVNSEITWTTAVRSDGTLWAWGNNGDGSLGLNDLVHRSSPVQVGTDTDWSKVGGLGAIKTTGSLWTWGLGTSGQLGSGFALSRSSPVQIGTSSWSIVSGKSNVNMSAITSNGLLFTWGSNAAGQLGDNTGTNKSSPVQVTSLFTLDQQNNYLTATSTTTFSWTAISGVQASMAIRSDGALFTWGSNTNGALGLNDRVHRSSPVQVGASSWIAISSGSLNNYAIRSDNTLWSWGQNDAGQLGQNDLVHRSSPVQIGTDNTWTTLAAGFSQVGAIRSNGQLYMWGLGTSGQLGEPASVNRSSPVQIGTSSWTMIATLNTSSAAIRIDGGLFTWGFNAQGQLGSNTTTNRQSPVQVGTSSWTQVAVGVSYTLAIRTDNTLWSWGGNSFGELGSVTVLPRSSPVQVGTSSWTSVYAGSQTSAAIRSDNTIWAWGDNQFGTLGQNNVITRSSPVQIGTGTWSKINLQYVQILGLESATNQLFTWGYNATGILGNNSVANASSPVFIRTANDSWTQVSMNPSINGTTAAIRNDKLLFVWGNNTTGQLGLGDLNVHRSSPTQLGTSSWTMVSSGTGHMIGETVNNLLYAWGDNSSGQLGNNTATSTSSPILIGTSNWSSIDAGSSSSYGLINNTLLYAWGLGTSGQLGDNSLISKSSPVQIVSYVPTPKQITGDTWKKISAGYSHSVGININDKLYGWGTAAANIFNAYSWINLAEGGAYSAGVRSDGALFTWGDNSIGNLGDNTIIHRSSPVQVGTSSWISVAAGGVTTNTDFTMLAILSDYTLWGWGAGGSGQLGQPNIFNRSSPIQISSFTSEAIQNTYLTNTGKTQYSWSAIAAGGSRPVSAAIRNDGRLFTWGDNLHGQLGQNDTIHRSSPVQVGTDSWTSVSVGNSALFAIRSNNTLWSWGGNNNGELGSLDRNHRSSPVQIGASSWTMVSANTDTNASNVTGYVTAILSNGWLFTWGYNANGELGLTSTTSRSSPVQVGTSSWSIVSAGWSNTAAIRTDGTLWTWGVNTNGALGDNTIVSKSSPVQITGTWTDVSAGVQFISAIKSGGTLWTWGINSAGYLGSNTIINRSSPVQVGANTWKKVVSTGASYAIRSDDTLWAWGQNPFGNLGDNTIINRSSPVQIGTGTWSNVNIKGYNAIATSINNQLYTWGLNTAGGLGLGDTIHRSSPVFIRSTNDSWNVISAGSGTMYGIRSDNTLWAWGVNTSGQLGLNDAINRSSPVQIGTSSWTQVSGALSYVAGITSDKRLFMWGINAQGQLGNNTITNRSSPVQVGTSSWNFVSAGYSSTSAIDLNGILYAWGGNTDGQLGDRTVISKSSPVQINAFTSAQIQQTYLTNTSKPATYSWSQVNAGISTSAAIRSDGMLFMWGNNTNGALGLNDIVHRSSPVQVGTSSWTAVGLAFSSTAAIRIDGALFTWGDNTNGQLGSNTTLHRSSPVQVGTSSWSQISSSNNLANFLALDAAYNLYAWGINTQGELAQNDLINRSSPVQIGTGISWIAISDRTGRAAIRNDNTLWVWGFNTAGQIGDNTIINRSSPVQVGGSWASVSAGSSTTAAITVDGLLYAWGNNNNGQLGLNDATNRSSPVQIGTNSWTTVDTGINALLGIRSDNLLFAWGINNTGQLGLLDGVSRSSPVQVGTSSWTMVSIGSTYSGGLDQLRGLYMWGNNPAGELGTSTITSTSSPVFLATTNASWTMVSMTLSQYAIRSDGYLFGWGRNNEGQLGLNISGATASRSAPVQIGTTVFTNISEGGISGAMATGIDNKLYVWGAGTTGMTGLNNLVSVSSPIQLGTNQAYAPPNLYSVPTQIGTSSWIQVSANDDNTFVIDPNNVLYAWGYNDYQPLLPAITAMGVSAVTVSNGFNHFGSTK